MISRHTVLVFLKGLAMGAADSVPGVSGGTIAFITNIYDELLDAIAAVNPGTLRILRQHGIAAAWQRIHGPFLLPLLCGIVLALVSSANVMVYLLEQHYTYLMCTFTGLILASVVLVGSHFSRWQKRDMVLVLGGAGVSVILALLPQFRGTDSLLYIFMCGALAICAMILPGISGAFILLLLGAYGPVLAALINLDLPVVGVFVLGCITGLLSFARLLSWLLHSRRQPTLAVLLGILAGSVYSLWPWRALTPCDLADAACQGTDHAFRYYRNEAVQAIDVVSGEPVSLMWCAVLVAAGALLVLGIEQIAGRFGKLSNSSGV